MNQILYKGIATALLLPVSLIFGCSDNKAPAHVQERAKAERLFDTQRSALEQAKEAAASIGQRNQRFPEKAKDID
ncbi:MAG: hypothetical protein H6968_13600 [Chromatiaceae bacterium]|nr:hypothetical protein [Chromatiaceae bacterium]